MREIALCSPEDYASPIMKEYIHQKCVEPDKQWIYDLIQNAGDSKLTNSKEKIFENHTEFMLCRDIHPGTDTRYLIIFKDLSLKTIRDLTGEHLPLLRKAHRVTIDFLKKWHPDSVSEYKIFFHYTPSVFQLHAHVSIPNAFYNTVRVHHLPLCILNLQSDSNWYKNAMILISLCRSVKALNLYSPINLPK